MGKLSKIVLVARHDQVTAERGGGDYGRVHGIGAACSGQQLAGSFSKLRRQRLETAALEQRTVSASPPLGHDGRRDGDGRSRKSACPKQCKSSGVPSFERNQHARVERNAACRPPNVGQ